MHIRHTDRRGNKARRLGRLLEPKKRKPGEGKKYRQSAGGERYADSFRTGAALLCLRRRASRNRATTESPLPTSKCYLWDSTAIPLVCSPVPPRIIDDFESFSAWMWVDLNESFRSSFVRFRFRCFNFHVNWFEFGENRYGVWGTSQSEITLSFMVLVLDSLSLRFEKWSLTNFLFEMVWLPCNLIWIDLVCGTWQNFHR